MLKPKKKGLILGVATPWGFASGGGGGGFSITPGAYAENGTGSTTYTFSGVTIGGAANANRLLVAGICIRSTGSLTSISVTADYGTGATAMTSVIDSNTVNGSDTQLWQLAAPTGTTATIVVTIGAAAVRCAVQTYGVVTTTPTAADKHATIVTPPSATLAVPAGGGTIFLAQGSVSVTGFTPTNFATDHVAAISSSNTWMAIGHDTSNSGSTVFAGAWTGTPPTVPGCAAACWGP